MEAIYISIEQKGLVVIVMCDPASASDNVMLGSVPHRFLVSGTVHYERYTVTRQQTRAISITSICQQIQSILNE